MTSRTGWPLALVATMACLAAACVDVPATLTRLVEAQRLTAAIQVSLSRSVEAANRAVMATDDEAAARASSESRDAVAAIDEQLRDLRQVLEALGYRPELERLEAFTVRFGEYRRLNEDVLGLMLENTNVKAGRLASGSSADAADALHQAVEAVAPLAPPASRAAAGEQAARAWAAVLEIRVLYPRHIAEADDAAMTELEARMSDAAGRARAGLEALGRAVPQGGRPMSDAQAALDRFMTIHAEIIDLSRRNSNVRALALTLGRKRTMAAEAEMQLTALEETLKTHEFRATR
jgi:hypothetical protein